MARKTAHETALTRQNLLVAGLDVFVEKGYSGATLDMVGAAAGCSRGAVYWHFGSKEKLLWALLAEQRLPIEELTSGAGELSVDFVQFRHALEQTVIEPRARQLCDLLLHKSERCDETHAISERLDKLRSQMGAVFTAILQACALQGRLHHSASVTRLSSFLAVCSIGLIFEGVRHPVELAAEHMGSGFDLMIAALPIR